MSIFCGAKALYEAISEKGTRLTRQRKSLVCNVFYTHRHKRTVAERLPYDKEGF